MTERTDGQVTWSDLGIWSGKTCLEHSAATKGKTLRQSSKRSSASRNRKPPILKCLKKAGTPGGDTTMKWEDDGAWLGECMMRNTGESPNVAVVSRLSQILEVTPPAKYSLSAKACQGILRRAERRGKDLPETLKAVLLMQSESGGGCDGGGKGALVQKDKSGTLGTGNDQTLFCMATQQGGAEVRSDDHAPTLTASAGMSGNNQPVVCAGFKLGNSERARSIGYAEEQSPTLNAECGGNKPAVVALDMSHACDVIRECGEFVPALQARMGTGGNQVPLTYQEVTGTLSPGAHAGSYNGQDAYNDMLVVSSEISPTLRAKANDPYREDMAAYIASVDCRNFCEGGETNGTLQAKESGGQSLNLNKAVRLAKYLADKRRNVILLLCDMTAPMLPCICPAADLECERSLGSVLAAAHVSENLVKNNLVTHKRLGYLTMLGMLKGENEYTYPPYNEVQARELIDCLREIAPYVVIDCGSYIANDILSAVALMEADSVLRLANADLKSISYLSSQLPLLRDAKWDTDKQYKTASNVKSQQAGDHMSQARSAHRAAGAQPRFSR